MSKTFRFIIIYEIKQIQPKTPKLNQSKTPKFSLYIYIQHV